MSILKRAPNENKKKLLNFEKKKMILSTKGEYESYLNQINCHICKKSFEHQYINDENCSLVKEYCHYTGKYRGAAHSICNLKYANKERKSFGFLQ